MCKSEGQVSWNTHRASLDDTKKGTVHRATYQLEDDRDERERVYDWVEEFLTPGHGTLPEGDEK